MSTNMTQSSMLLHDEKPVGDRHCEYNIYANLEHTMIYVISRYLEMCKLFRMMHRNSEKHL